MMFRRALPEASGGTRETLIIAAGAPSPQTVAAVTPAAATHQGLHLADAPSRNRPPWHGSDYSSRVSSLRNAATACSTEG
jgi:hypothetical protein